MKEIIKSNLLGKKIESFNDTEMMNLLIDISFAINGRFDKLEATQKKQLTTWTKTRYSNNTKEEMLFAFSLLLEEKILPKYELYGNICPKTISDVMRAYSEYTFKFRNEPEATQLPEASKETIKAANKKYFIENILKPIYDKYTEREDGYVDYEENPVYTPNYLGKRIVDYGLLVFEDARKKEIAIEAKQEAKTYYKDYKTDDVEMKRSVNKALVMEDEKEKAKRNRQKYEKPNKKSVFDEKWEYLYSKKIVEETFKLYDLVGYPIDGIVNL